MDDRKFYISVPNLLHSATQSMPGLHGHLALPQASSFRCPSHTFIYTLPLHPNFPYTSTLTTTPVAIRRKSLSPYTFRSGTPHIPTGTITSVSSYDLMHDAHFYPDPNHFDGLRYTRKTMPSVEYGVGGQGKGGERENPMYGDSITEVKREFPVWGFGGHVWFVTYPSFPLPSLPSPLSPLPISFPLIDTFHSPPSPSPSLSLPLPLPSPNPSLPIVTNY